mmetsp:Transcript_18177/g.21000  ORF Transcript_18177/g.21000 Transcript_18177/m.21000 type:complete len:264 (-) Transcript_18177:4-795(-)
MSTRTSKRDSVCASSDNRLTSKKQRTLDDCAKILVNKFQKHYATNAKEDKLWVKAFSLIAEEYKGIENVIYPGCYIHVTPSFVFPKVVYVDSFKGKKNFMKSFYENETVLNELVYKHSTESRAIVYHQNDYSGNFSEPELSFDMLISLSAGAISKDCQKYLKKGGILFANNDHGDASIASTLKNLELVGAISGNRYCELENEAGVKFLSDRQQLERSFVLKKSGKRISFDQAIQNSKVGRSSWPCKLISPSKEVLGYIFKKVK